MKKNKNIVISIRFFIGVISILFFQFLSSTDGEVLAGLSSSAESTWLDFSGEIVFASPIVKSPFPPVGEAGGPQKHDFSSDCEVLKAFSAGNQRIAEMSNSETLDNFPFCGFNSRKILQRFSEGVSSLIKPPVKSFRIVSIGSSPSLSPSKFRWPVNGSISSGYGLRRHPVTRRRSFHAGIDIRSKYGTPVVTPSDGVVVNSSRVGANGRMVRVLTPGGLTLSFAHLSGYKCFRGQQVRRGQIVGLVGSSGRATGPHLHFTVQKNGRYINPMTCLGKK